MIFASGPKQLVVQDAFDRTEISLVYLVWFTPITNIGASAEDAEMMTWASCAKTTSAHVTVMKKTNAWAL